MGVGVGTFTDPTCTLFSNGSVVTQAGSTAQLSGTVNAGSTLMAFALPKEQRLPR